MGLVCWVMENNGLKEYEERIVICEDMEMIRRKMKGVVDREEEDEKEREEERVREGEKEMIRWVVKGMRKKGIGEKVYVCMDRVMREGGKIGGKLEIDCGGGVRMYGIVKKVVEVRDIKESL